MTTARQYAGEADYVAMRALLCETYTICGSPDYATVGDIDWWRFADDDPDAIAQTRLWLDDSGVLAGIAWPGKDEVDLLTHPRRRSIEGEMLAWAEERHREHVGDDGAATFRTWAYTSDETRIATLEQRGYARSDKHLIYWFRTLNTVPEISLPAGYAIRRAHGETEIEARAAVHRAAFAPSRMSAEKHRRVMTAPTYQPELDLVVVAPGGDLAAFCIVWLDEVNAHGVFEPVGCHPAHQRRGLARAVMSEGMRRLVELGARSACVVSGGDAEPAGRLYASAGFTLLDRNYAWEKPLG